MEGQTSGNNGSLSSQNRRRNKLILIVSIGGTIVIITVAISILLFIRRKRIQATERLTSSGVQVGRFTSTGNVPFPISANGSDNSGGPGSIPPRPIGGGTTSPNTSGNRQQRRPRNNRPSGGQADDEESNSTTEEDDSYDKFEDAKGILITKMKDLMVERNTWRQTTQESDFKNDIEGVQVLFNQAKTDDPTVSDPEFPGTDWKQLFLKLLQNHIAKSFKTKIDTSPDIRRVCVGDADGSGINKTECEAWGILVGEYIKFKPDVFVKIQPPVNPIFKGIHDATSLSAYLTDLGQARYQALLQRDFDVNPLSFQAESRDVIITILEDLKVIASDPTAKSTFESRAKQGNSLTLVRALMDSITNAFRCHKLYSDPCFHPFTFFSLVEWKFLHEHCLTLKALKSSDIELEMNKRGFRGNLSILLRDLKEKIHQLSQNPDNQALWDQTMKASDLIRYVDRVESRNLEPGSWIGEIGNFLNQSPMYIRRQLITDAKSFMQIYVGKQMMRKDKGKNELLYELARKLSPTTYTAEWDATTYGTLLNYKEYESRKVHIFKNLSSEMDTLDISKLNRLLQDQILNATDKITSMKGLRTTLAHDIDENLMSLNSLRPIISRTDDDATLKRKTLHYLHTQYLIGSLEDFITKNVIDEGFNRNRPNTHKVIDFMTGYLAIEPTFTALLPESIRNIRDGASLRKYYEEDLPKARTAYEKCLRDIVEVQMVKMSPGEIQYVHQVSLLNQINQCVDQAKLFMRTLGFDTPQFEPDYLKNAFKNFPPEAEILELAAYQISQLVMVIPTDPQLTNNLTVLSLINRNFLSYQQLLVKVGDIRQKYQDFYVKVLDIIYEKVIDKAVTPFDASNVVSQRQMLKNYLLLPHVSINPVKHSKILKFIELLELLTKRYDRMDDVCTAGGIPTVLQAKYRLEAIAIIGSRDLGCETRTHAYWDVHDVLWAFKDSKVCLQYDGSSYNITDILMNDRSLDELSRSIQAQKEGGHYVKTPDGNLQIDPPPSVNGRLYYKNVLVPLWPFIKDRPLMEFTAVIDQTLNVQYLFRLDAACQRLLNRQYNLDIELGNNSDWWDFKIQSQNPLSTLPKLFPHLDAKTMPLFMNFIQYFRSLTFFGGSIRSNSLPLMMEALKAQQEVINKAAEVNYGFATTALVALGGGNSTDPITMAQFTFAFSDPLFLSSTNEVKENFVKSLEEFYVAYHKVHFQNELIYSSTDKTSKKAIQACIALNSLRNLARAIAINGVFNPATSEMQAAGHRLDQFQIGHTYRELTLDPNGTGFARDFTEFLQTGGFNNFALALKSAGTNLSIANDYIYSLEQADSVYGASMINACKLHTKALRTIYERQVAMDCIPSIHTVDPIHTAIDYSKHGIEFPSNYSYIPMKMIAGKDAEKAAIIDKQTIYAEKIKAASDACIDYIKDVANGDLNICQDSLLTYGRDEYQKYEALQRLKPIQSMNVEITKPEETWFIPAVVQGDQALLGVLRERYIFEHAFEVYCKETWKGIIAYYRVELPAGTDSDPDTQHLFDRFVQLWFIGKLAGKAMSYYSSESLFKADIDGEYSLDLEVGKNSSDPRISGLFGFIAQLPIVRDPKEAKLMERFIGKCAQVYLPDKSIAIRAIDKSIHQALRVMPERVDLWQRDQIYAKLKTLLPPDPYEYVYDPYH